jgi:hypothetical protein
LISKIKDIRQSHVKEEEKKKSNICNRVLVPDDTYLILNTYFMPSSQVQKLGFKIVNSTTKLLPA